MAWSLSQLHDYINANAASYGLDPATAWTVWSREGANTGVFNGPGGTPGSGWYATNQNDGGHSLGPFQLNDQGLGATFTAKTGLPITPDTIQQQADFSMAWAAKNGWDPNGGGWHAATNAGIGNWDGINGNPGKSSITSMDDGTTPGGGTGSQPGGGTNAGHPLLNQLGIGGSGSAPGAVAGGSGIPIQITNAADVGKQPGTDIKSGLDTASKSIDALNKGLTADTQSLTTTSTKISDFAGQLTEGQSGIWSRVLIGIAGVVLLGLALWMLGAKAVVSVAEAPVKAVNRSMRGRG